MRTLNPVVLVLGANGFIGANIFRALYSPFVYGTDSGKDSWRLKGFNNIIREVDLLYDPDLMMLFRCLKPDIVINCAAYGSSSYEENTAQMYATNFDLVRKIVNSGNAHYIHAGTSSEYGFNNAGAKETQLLTPTSDYAASKAAASAFLYSSGKIQNHPVINLRLYSVYGPLEDASRLIPSLVAAADYNKFPPFVNEKITRDFVFIYDVVRAFKLAIEMVQASSTHWGETYNIGSGAPTTMQELANKAKKLFCITATPTFDLQQRAWDNYSTWYADPLKAYEDLFWKATTSLESGLSETYSWYKELPNKVEYVQSGKNFK